MDYRYIDQQPALSEVVAACAGAPVLAVDTEFARFNTYYPIVGLIQIFDGTNCYLIDPLAVEDLSPLAALMVSPETLKVFHACSEDLEVFQHSLGVIPAPMFDSQIAAAILGVGFSMSYQNLVGHYLDINVPKEETRSDWLKRPLTQSQLDYAALDVIYLYEVYQLQKQQLSSLSREHWVEQECLNMGVDIATMIEPNDFYRKVKGVQQLKPRQLHVLQALCAWREIEARRQDAPRNRIVDQKALIGIAKSEDLDRSQLQSDIKMSSKEIRKYGDQLLALSKQARSQPEQHYPSVLEKDRKPIDNQQLKSLRAFADKRASELNVSPELLVKRRHLEELIRARQLPSELCGWRQSVIGDDLLALVTQGAES